MPQPADSLDYVTITGHFGQSRTNAQGQKVVVLPDPGATVTAVPSRDYAQYGDLTTPFTIDIAAEVGVVDPATGLVTLKLLDLHSEKLTNRIPTDLNSWTLHFDRFEYDGRPFYRPDAPVAPTIGGPTDIANLAPGGRFRGEVITRGATGVCVETLEIDADTLHLVTTLDDGTEVDAGPVPFLDVKVGNVTTSEPGSEAQVTRRIVGLQAFLDIVFPQGQRGPAGFNATNAAQDDAAIAAFISTAGKQAFAAVKARIEAVAPTLTMTTGNAGAGDFYIDVRDRVRNWVLSNGLGTGALRDAVDQRIGQLAASVNTILTTKGDQVVRDADGGVRVPVGTEGASWRADPAAATGVRWSTRTDRSGTGAPGYAAAPGSTYLQTDAAALGGLLLWEKQSPAAETTGWVVVRGDTGWRDVTALAGQAGPTYSGTIAVRRTERGVRFRGNNYGSNQTSGVVNIFSSTKPIPDGFRIAQGQVFTTYNFVNNIGASAVFTYALDVALSIIGNLTAGQSGAGMDQTNARQKLTGESTWLACTQPWPASLPGSAVT